jgi:TPR repeat protein
LQLVRPLAEQGDARAEAALGTTYETGRGVSQDNAEAVKWYRLAADQGNARGEAGLGSMYLQGYGQSEDYVEAAKEAAKTWPSSATYMKMQAMKWFRLAAEQGDDRGQAGLGYLYATGISQLLPADLPEAAKWYRLSADQGNAFAQTSLGYSYANGRGLPQDYAEAMKWYRLAAGQGFVVAQNNLGSMYHMGYGVPRDDAQALQWYHMAAERGNRAAQQNIDSIERERQAQLNNRINAIFVLISLAGFVIFLFYFAKQLKNVARFLFASVRQLISLVHSGPALQRGLACFWMAVSAGWLVHSLWWVVANCQSGYYGYDCTSGTFHIERAHLDALGVWGYVLTVPVAMLFVTIAAYWIIRGFQSRRPADYLDSNP